MRPISSLRPPLAAGIVVVTSLAAGAIVVMGWPGAEAQAPFELTDIRVEPLRSSHRRTNPLTIPNAGRRDIGWPATIRRARPPEPAPSRTTTGYKAFFLPARVLRLRRKAFRSVRGGHATAPGRRPA